MRRLAFAFVYLGYVAVFVLGVDYVLFWRPFVAELRDRRPEERAVPRHVDDATMRRLGSLLADRSSSFPRFERAKPSGVVRLCALGDSFTYGDEVADGDDYPAQLEQIFSERGATNVEVLNFGNSWYGFHQAFVLWHDVARDFGCDFVLLGPDCFQPDRDTTFNHTNLGFPYYLHARYVLDGDGVRLEEVRGETQEERFDGYFGFFPRMPYLRYDRSAPAFLRALLPRGRTLLNPFYYDGRDAAVEAHASYERLLRAMAADGPPILLLHSLPEIVGLANHVGNARLVSVLAPRNERYPYAAPGGHYSAFGNRWIAEQYFALLAGGDWPPGLLDFDDVEPARSGPREAPVGRPAAVESFASIEARLAGHPAGLLAVASADPGERIGAVGDLAGAGVGSLLAILEPDTRLVDAAFVPLAGVLADDAAVVMRIEASGRAEDVVVGRARLLDPRVSIAAVRIAGFELAGDLVFRGSESVPLERLRGAGVTILAGSHPALRGGADEEGRAIRFVPVAGSLRALRVGASQHAPMRDLAESGTLLLRLATEAGTALDVSLSRWRKSPGRVLPSGRRLPQTIVIAGGRAVVSQRGADRGAQR